MRHGADGHRSAAALARHRLGDHPRTTTLARVIDQRQRLPLSRASSSPDWGDAVWLG
jgi:hypothetical protein